MELNNMNEVTMGPMSKSGGKICHGRVKNEGGCFSLFLWLSGWPAPSMHPRPWPASPEGRELSVCFFPCFLWLFLRGPFLKVTDDSGDNRPASPALGTAE